MLSDANIRAINYQIATELRAVDSIARTRDEKNAALDRIAKLKAILDEKPADSSVDVDQIADRIVDVVINRLSDPKPTRSPLVTLLERLAQ